MKVYGGVEVYSTISHLGTKWRGMISFKLRQLYVLGNSPLHELYRAVGVSQRQSGCHAHAANGTPIPRPSSQ